jgi:hypothetical protein
MVMVFWSGWGGLDDWNRLVGFAEMDFVVGAAKRANAFERFDDPKGEARLA